MLRSDVNSQERRYQVGQLQPNYATGLTRRAPPGGEKRALQNYRRIFFLSNYCTLFTPRHCRFVERTENALVWTMCKMRAFQPSFRSILCPYTCINVYEIRLQPNLVHIYARMPCINVHIYARMHIYAHLAIISTSHRIHSPTYMRTFSAFTFITKSHLSSHIKKATDGSKMMFDVAEF